MDYREVIKNEFLKRRSEDPFFSLREFAKLINLTPMHLSYLLRGERGLSRSKAEEIALKFKFNYNQMKKFGFMVSAQSGRSMWERQLAKQRLKTKSMQERKF